MWSGGRQQPNFWSGGGGRQPGAVVHGWARATSSGVLGVLRLTCCDSLHRRVAPSHAQVCSKLAMSLSAACVHVCGAGSVLRRWMLGGLLWPAADDGYTDFDSWRYWVSFNRSTDELCGCPRCVVLFELARLQLLGLLLCRYADDGSTDYDSMRYFVEVASPPSPPGTDC